MDSLYELLHGLHPKELSVVKNYLDFLSGQKKSEESLTRKLFNYLLYNKEEPDDKDACAFIYGEGQNKEEQFKKLRYRLRTKILDALSAEPGEEKKETMDEVDYAAYRVKKKSIQARLLFFSNPKLEIASELLEEIISECKKFEFYGILVEHLNIKKWRYTIKDGEDEFEKDITKVRYYKKCEDALIIANDYYYKLFFLAEKNEKDDKKVKSFLADVIAELSNLVILTKSNMVKYYLKFFEIYYYMYYKDYQKARDICSQLRDIILQNPAVKRKQRLGITYDYFSRCELLLEKFDKAAEYAKSAQENFIPGSYNYSLSKEQEYYALFYNKKFNEAEAVALQMLGSATRKELGEIRYAKYSFLYANVLFKQGKYKEALRILQQKWEVSKEKESREVELRVLRAMAHIELAESNEAGLETGNLKKFIQRNGDKTTLRHKIILKLLLQAQRKKFTFNEKSAPALQQLSSEEEGCKWELLSAELIPFHEWARQKM